MILYASFEKKKVNKHPKNLTNLLSWFFHKAMCHPLVTKMTLKPELLLFEIVIATFLHDFLQHIPFLLYKME